MPSRGVSGLFLERNAIESLQVLWQRSRGGIWELEQRVRLQTPWNPFQAPWPLNTTAIVILLQKNSIFFVLVVIWVFGSVWMFGKFVLVCDFKRLEWVFIEVFGWRLVRVVARVARWVLSGEKICSLSAVYYIENFKIEVRWDGMQGPLDHGM